MSPEQREKKKKADRDRRARLKAQGLDAKAIRAGVGEAMKKPRPAQKAPKPAPSGTRMQVISFKGTQKHADKLRELGGGLWARNAIENA